jgi:hypothetical protein
MCACHGSEQGGRTGDQGRRCLQSLNCYGANQPEAVASTAAIVAKRFSRSLVNSGELYADTLLSRMRSRKSSNQGS